VNASMLADEQLEKIMYALTLADRQPRRALWLERGFKKMHARGQSALFNYWKKRLSEDSDAQELANQVWVQYVERHATGNGILSKPGSLARPGDLLAWMIHRVTGITPGPACSCRTRQRQMNEWGWLGCLRNRATILAWIGDEAGKRGHHLGRTAALDLLRAALQEWRAQRQARVDTPPPA